MNFEEILLVSNDSLKVSRIIKTVGDTFKVIVANSDTALEAVVKNPLISGVIYDLSDESDKILHTFVVMRSMHEDLRMIILASTSFMKSLNGGNPDGVFWCFDCLDENAFREKLKEFKYRKVSTSTRMRFVEAVFDSSPVGIAIIPRDDIKRAFINRSFQAITGYNREEFASIGWEALTHPDDQKIDREAKEHQVILGEKHYNLEKRLVRKDGTIAWVGEYMALIEEKEENAVVRLIMIRNIENRKVIEEKLKESDRSRSTLLQNLPGLAYRCANDVNWTMEFVSDGASDLTGYDPQELINNRIISFNDIISRKYRKILLDEWDKVIEKRGVMQYEYEIILKDGTTKWVYERGVPIYDYQGNVLALEGIIIDISRSKKLEKQLQYFSDFNHKLKLPNRELLSTKIQKKLDAGNTLGTIILVNLKDTQRLYRSHGYQYVELLTASLVNKLKTLETNRIILYYLEEDIYVYYAKYRMKDSEIKEFYHSINVAILRTIIREQIRCNVGVAHLSKTSLTSDACFQKARIASEFIRDENRLLNINYYDDAMEKMVKREDDLKKELIETSFDESAGTLRLVFQPIIDLKTGKISSFEALARYKSPKYGHISPLEFIPIVEKNRIIVAFGKKIIELALDFVKKLINSGIKNCPVAINISALQLLDSDFIDDLILRIEKAGVPHNLIMVEVTESIFSANYTQLNASLHELNEFGIKTAIDDFGTGFSSLARIEKMRFNTIKMDRTFIEPLNNETLNYSTVPEVINICKKFNIVSLAEGIETKEQYDILQNLGCQYGQGYYMSRPLEVVDAIKFVKENI